MDQRRKNLVFFDVDHTLIDGNSGYFASFRLVKHKVLKKRRLIQAVYYKLLSNLQDQNIEKIYRIAMQDMVGCSQTYILKIGRECLERDLIPRFFTQTIDLLRKHKEQGDIIVLLTSGPYMVMNNLARHLGADDFYAIGPSVENDSIKPDIPKPLCYGDGKAHYAKIASQKFGIPLERAYFYTDHHTDIPLLELVGFPQCVNPDLRLKRHARKKNWGVHWVKRG